jgi:hypothetical protein
MTITQFAGCALGLALTLSAAPAAQAQVDTTRRVTSDQRIPVRKDAGTPSITRRESGGLVTISAATARIDSLETAAEAYRLRLNALETENAGLVSRSAATDRHIAALSDSLRMVRGELTSSRAELTSMRSELAAASLRAAAMADTVRWLNQRFANFRNGSVFGGSGFYIGAGTGANFATGTLRDLGYASALHLQVPIGWSKRGNLLGIRTEWAMQRLEGRARGSFTNLDPEIYSGVAMLTLDLPLNSEKNTAFYLMGGGGVYQFRHIGATSSLTTSFPGIDASSKSEVKWGLTGGAGLEVHVIGASSIYLQTAFTNVSAGGRNLNWIPVNIGVILR